MNFLDLVKQRSSVRSYEKTDVPQEVLHRILEAGRLAPSARNLQNWQFWLLKLNSESFEDKAVEACLNQSFIKEAPYLLAVSADTSRSMPCGHKAGVVDAAIAMTHMLLQATSEGLGSCWLGAFDQALASSLFGVPEGQTLVAISPIGYPSDTVKKRPRKDLEEIVHYVNY